MNTRRDPALTVPGAGRASFGQAGLSATGLKWSALHDAAAIVAGLAGMPAEPMQPALRNFPSLAREATGWKRTLVDQGVDDLSVIMEVGIAALLAAHARGCDTRAAACSLWREFECARQGLLALVAINEGKRLTF